MLSQATPESAADSATRTAFVEFLDGLVGAIPHILSGLVFLVGSYLVIKPALTVTRFVLSRLLPAEQKLIVDLSVAVVGLFLWFGAALALLKIVGFLLGDCLRLLMFERLFIHRNDLVARVCL